MKQHTIIILSLCGLVALTSGLVPGGGLDTNKGEDDNANWKPWVPIVMKARTIKEIPMDGKPNIPELAKKLGLNDLVKFVVKAQLDKVLSGEGPFTLFGPTDEAFSKQSSKPADLAKLLEYHVLPRLVPSVELKDELLVKTVNGKNARVNLYPKGKEAFTVATVQCAPIDLNKTDNVASNGIIHVLNGVMTPDLGTLAEALKADKNYTTLTKALEISGLNKTLSGKGPFTVFGPDDAAFKKLPAKKLADLLKDKKKLTEVLEYHVVEGTYCSHGLFSGSLKTVNGKDIKLTVSKDGVMVNKAKVITADVSVSNGVGHGIDTVLLPSPL